MTAPKDAPTNVKSIISKINRYELLMDNIEQKEQYRTKQFGIQATDYTDSLWNNAYKQWNGEYFAKQHVINYDPAMIPLFGGDLKIWNNSRFKIIDGGDYVLLMFTVSPTEDEDKVIVYTIGEYWGEALQWKNALKRAGGRTINNDWALEGYYSTNGLDSCFTVFEMLGMSISMSGWRTTDYDLRTIKYIKKANESEFNEVIDNTHDIHLSSMLPFTTFININASDLNLNTIPGFLGLEIFIGTEGSLVNDEPNINGLKCHIRPYDDNFEYTFNPEIYNIGCDTYMRDNKLYMYYDSVAISPIVKSTDSTDEVGIYYFIILTVGMSSRVQEEAEMRIAYTVVKLILNNGDFSIEVDKWHKPDLNGLDKELGNMFYWSSVVWDKKYEEFVLTYNNVIGDVENSSFNHMVSLNLKPSLNQSTKSVSFSTSYTISVNNTHINTADLIYFNTHDTAMIATTKSIAERLGNTWTPDKCQIDLESENAKIVDADTNSDKCYAVSVYKYNTPHTEGEYTNCTDRIAIYAMNYNMEEDWKNRIAQYRLDN